MTSTRILHGHCLDVLATLPDNSVHCVVTSPPYYGLRDYKTPEVSFPAGTFTPVAGLPSMALPAWTGHLGLEPDPWQFVGHMVQIFREVRRVLREDGTLWLNFGDSYANDTKWGGSTGGKHVNGLHGKSGVGRTKQITGLKPKDLILMPARVALALQADGWYLRSDIIWHKPNPMPESVTDRPTKAHEYIFLMSKSERYFYDAEAIKEAVTGNAHARGDGVNAKAKTPGANSRIHKTHVGAAPQPRQNESWSAAVAGLVDSRNKRTVWTVATSPYPDAHFATYPPDLIRPCILAGTSARGCCPDCGAPWERVTATITTGWKPGCDCYTMHALTDMPPEEWPTVPAVVLDPFGGSGTTAEVAQEYARTAIVIELGEHHLPLIKRRLNTTPGLNLH